MSENFFSIKINQKGFAPILLLVGILILVAIVGGIYAWQQKQSEYGMLSRDDTIYHTQSNELNSPNSSDQKIFTSKDNLYQVSIPSNLTITYSGGSPEFGSDNKAWLQIIAWDYSDLSTVKEKWQSQGCGGSDPNSGCAPIPNKEVSQRVVNGYDVYVKVENSGQMHAFIPNTAINKTIEIDSIDLKDRKIFDQIVSSFKFFGEENGKPCGYLSPRGDDTSCPNGYTCQNINPNNDAGGTCVKQK